jgi:hypothetical protein
MSGSRAASAVACSGNRLLRPATFHVMRRTTPSHVSFVGRAARSARAQLRASGRAPARRSRPRTHSRQSNRVPRGGAPSNRPRASGTPRSWRPTTAAAKSPILRKPPASPARVCTRSSTTSSTGDRDRSAPRRALVSSRHRGRRRALSAALIHDAVARDDALRRAAGRRSSSRHRESCMPVALIFGTQRRGRTSPVSAPDGWS